MFISLKMHDRTFYELKLYYVQCLKLRFLQLYHKLKIKNKNGILFLGIYLKGLLKIYFKIVC